MNLYTILILLYLMIYLNFGLLLLSIPILSIQFLFYKKKYLINLFKNIVDSTISFFIYNVLFTNIYINSQRNFEMITNDHGRQKIVISNHLSELDFFLCLLFVNNIKNYINTEISFISKKMIGYYLIYFGIYGTLTNDIFIERNFEKDANKLSKKLDFNIMFMFPEGTCFTKDRKQKSDEYCNKNNLQIYKYHLYPRMTGISEIIKNNPKISCLYDITIIYDNIPKKKYGNHYSLINYINKNSLPQKVYININKYNIHYNKEDLVEKIEDIYKNKDNFIKNFDVDNNNFVPLKYNYYIGFINFNLMNFVCLSSIYLFCKYNYIKYTYISEIIIFYIFFYFFG